MYFSMFAITVLMDYLTKTSASPLQKAFVETNDPHASSVSNTLITHIAFVNKVRKIKPIMNLY